MIIDLRHSKLFKVNPDIRFTNRYQVKRGTWDDLWRKHIGLEYSNEDLRDYLFMRHARTISFMSMQRWLDRTQIYSIAHAYIKKGGKIVNSNVFGDLEELVINELIKPIKNGDSVRSKSII